MGKARHGARKGRARKLEGNARQGKTQVMVRSKASRKVRQSMERGRHEKGWGR
jgi:hypothetical protein